MKKKLLSVVLSGALVVIVGCSGKQVHNSDRSSESAKAGMSETSKDRQEAVDRLNDSAKVLDELMGTPESAIPEWVLSKAQCVMIVPSMVKGGFVVGGQHGRGAATCRNKGRWSAPQMVTITGGSWGAQIGAEAVDLVLVFTGNKGAEDLLNNSVKLGGEASVAAGPFGRSAQAATDASIKAQILAYSRTRGLFAGLELGGASVRGDDDSDRGLYGEPMTSRQVLSGTVQPPAGSEQFMASIRKNFREAVNAN
jgi:lipid-binding SYLF domain-containing protein